MSKMMKQFERRLVPDWQQEQKRGRFLHYGKIKEHKWDVSKEADIR